MIRNNKRIGQFSQRRRHAKAASEETAEQIPRRGSDSEAKDEPSGDEVLIHRHVIAVVSFDADGEEVVGEELQPDEAGCEPAIGNSACIDEGIEPEEACELSIGCGADRIAHAAAEIEVHHAAADNIEHQLDINRSHSVPGYDPPYVEYENGTFLVERGNDAITSYSPGLGVGHRFAVSSQLTFRRTYGGGSYNTYMINPEDFSGSYSITIIKYIEVNDYNAAAGAYIHWTDDLIVDYSLSFGYPSGISVSLDPEWQYSYEESSEVAVDFQNFV